jgi:hypothetical protein
MAYAVVPQAISHIGRPSADSHHEIAGRGVVSWILGRIGQGPHSAAAAIGQ